MFAEPGGLLRAVAEGIAIHTSIARSSGPEGPLKSAQGGTLKERGSSAKPR